MGYQRVMCPTEIRAEIAAATSDLTPAESNTNATNTSTAKSDTTSSAAVTTAYYGPMFVVRPRARDRTRGRSKLNTTRLLVASVFLLGASFVLVLLALLQAVRAVH